MRHNVTTPGGFFVGLGGIAAFCAVAAGVYCWVGKPAASNEFEPQKTALGLTAKSKEKDKQKEIDTLLATAALEYNGGKTPNLNDLEDLRGVVRFREANKSNADSMALLTAKSTVEGKTVLQAAMDSVATEIAAKKPIASEVKVDLLAPAADAPVSMPNFQGGGAKTITFPTPVLSVPAAPEVPKPAASLDKPAENGDNSAAKLESTFQNEPIFAAKLSNFATKLESTFQNEPVSAAKGSNPATNLPLVPAPIKTSEALAPIVPAPNRPPLLNGTSSTDEGQPVCRVRHLAEYSSVALAREVIFSQDERLTFSHKQRPLVCQSIV